LGKTRVFPKGFKKELRNLGKISWLETSEAGDFQKTFGFLGKESDPSKKG